jgi:hypothetical protein
MKTHLLGFLLPLTGLLAFAGCTSAADDNTASDEGALTGAELDDSVATTLLAGGCSVVVDGQASTTKGSGGPCPTQLSKMLDLLEGKTKSAGDAPQKPKTFVVSEQGDRPGNGVQYRFVVASKAKSNPLWIATVSDANVGEGEVEAIGFSPSLQAFAYYKVEGNRWVRKGDGTKIKSTTKGKDVPFECARCHSSGAPLMKELHDSWANWDSTWFSMPKPKGANALFSRLFDAKTLADDLEPEIIAGIHLHSKGRVDRANREGALSGVLTQLMCEVGEPSIIGAHSRNQQRFGKVNTFSSMLPTSLLLNPLWSPPQTGTGEELGLEQALGVKTGVDELSQSIDSDAYSKAIEANRQTIGGQPGDAMFPMASPQAGYADLDAVQELLRQKLIDKDIVADILMTDFTVSSFSKVRCDLAETMPTTWKTPDELRTTWAANLAGSTARGAKGLKGRLENKTDLKTHEKALSTFVNACKARPAPALTVDALKIISQRRVEFTQRYGDVGQGIVESSFLIPKDQLGSKPNAIRLNATSCEIEPTSAKFAGEDSAVASSGSGAPATGVLPEGSGPIPESTLQSVGRYEVVSEQLNCRAGAGTGNAVEQTHLKGQFLDATEAAGRPRLAVAPDGKTWLLVQRDGAKPCYVSARFPFIEPRP